MVFIQFQTNINMKKCLALIPVLMLILVVSGCTQQGAMMNNFQNAIEELEINGENPQCFSETGSTGYYLYCAIDAGYSPIMIAEFFDSSTVQNYLEDYKQSIIDIMNQPDFSSLNITYTFSEVSISGEIIDKITTISDEESSSLYMWVHGSFLFGIRFTDEPTSQMVAEAIIDVYK